jgi:transcriptional regulator with XRE-family HTH domain
MVDSQFLTINEVAERLHVSRRWLEGFLRGKDIGKIAGRRRIFSAAEVQAIYWSLPKCQSSLCPRERGSLQTGAFEELTSASKLTKLRELLREPSPQKSSRRGSTKSNVVAFKRS